MRKTIARVTTLRQASLIAGLNAEGLVNTLRKEVGQDNLSGLKGKTEKYNTAQPDWYDENAVVNTINAGEMLNNGEQPVHEVLAQVKKLGDDEILEVIAPFVPAPLLDKTISMSYKHWVHQEKANEVYIYLKR